MKHTDDERLDELVRRAFEARVEAQAQPDMVPEPVYRNAARTRCTGRTAFAASSRQRALLAAAAVAFCAVLPAGLWTASAGGGTLREVAERAYTEGVVGESPAYFMSLMKQGGAAL